MVDDHSRLCSDCLDIYQLELGVKVLIVDDDKDVLESLKCWLDYYGLTVTSCENATEALLSSLREEFHYIITDYEMPGMNGVELTRRLRASLRNAIIIGMSGSERGEEFLRTGANDFIQKPFSASKIAMMIDGGNILA